MRALWIEDGVRFRDDLPPTEPAPGEALVRVRLAGICNTDLELAQGYLGFRGVPGHEFVGEVVQAPPEAGLTPGQRVVGEINAGCGDCDWCRGEAIGAFRPGGDPHQLLAQDGLAISAGDSRHCPNRTVLGILGRNGALAEYLTLPVRNLLLVPDSLPDEQAVFVEPVAAACEVLDQVATGPGVRALVLGDGKLGLLIAQALAAAGCDVLTVGRHESKLAILRNRGIATALGSDLPVEKFDLVVEATGSDAGLAVAIRAVRPRGTLVLKTTVAGESTLSLAPLVIDEIRLLGSRCGRFGPAVERLVAGEVDVEPLIAGRYNLTDGLAAFDRAAERATLKVLVAP